MAPTLSIQMDSKIPISNHSNFVDFILIVWMARQSLFRASVLRWHLQWRRPWCLYPSVALRPSNVQIPKPSMPKPEAADLNLARTHDAN